MLLDLFLSSLTFSLSRISLSFYFIVSSIYNSNEFSDITYLYFLGVDCLAVFNNLGSPSTNN
jgi:hypothetical protein